MRMCARARAHTHTRTHTAQMKSPALICKHSTTTHLGEQDRHVGALLSKTEACLLPGLAAL